MVSFGSIGEHLARKVLLKVCHSLPAETIIAKISDQIREFRGDKPQNDDITLAVVKTW